MTDNTAFAHGFRDKTRGGYPVRNVRRTHEPTFPFVAEINVGEVWRFSMFKESGFWFSSEDDRDLIPILMPEQIADGWTLHTTGKRPVADDVMVRVMLRDGGSPKNTRLACNWNWREVGRSAIIAYRPEPVEIDITKPLELADGTKVGNARRGANGFMRVDLISGPSCGLIGGDLGRLFEANGVHVNGQLPNLRNVKADPLADAIALIEAHGKMVVYGPKPAEPDWERYREMADIFCNSRGFLGGDMAMVPALLAARNHDPDVVALVRWARKKLTAMDRDAALLAPFAAIKGE